MKYRVKVQHTFELTEDEMELAQKSYRVYADPDEKLHDYIKSNLIIFVTAQIIDASSNSEATTRPAVWSISSVMAGPPSRGARSRP